MTIAFRRLYHGGYVQVNSRYHFYRILNRKLNMNMNIDMTFEILTAGGKLGSNNPLLFADRRVATSNYGS